MKKRIRILFTIADLALLSQNCAFFDSKYQEREKQKQKKKSGNVFGLRDASLDFLILSIHLHIWAILFLVYSCGRQPFFRWNIIYFPTEWISRKKKSASISIRFRKRFDKVFFIWPLKNCIHCSWAYFASHRRLNKIDSINKLGFQNISFGIIKWRILHVVLLHQEVLAFYTLYININHTTI